jgi:hypothetical protein
MGQQSQSSQGSKGGNSVGQPIGPGGYATSPYQQNPAQQGSFFSNGGSNRPPMQALPFQMQSGYQPPMYSGAQNQMQPPRQMDGYGSQFNPMQAYQNALQGMQNPLARGGFPGGDPQPVGGGGNMGSGTFDPNAQPGVQTFNNGAYANWGQPQQPPPPNPGVQTFQNGAYAAQGLQPPNPYAVTNPLARPFTNGY